MAGNKTPVMILQELAVKLSKPIEFQLIYQDPVSTNTPIFRYAVVFAGKRLFGEGRSKKQAKHNSARLMLEELKSDDAYRNEGGGTIPIPQVESPQNSTLQINAIGVLAERCEENNIRQAVYTEIADAGPPHAKEFTYVCQVGHFKVTATNYTKKRAKQDAANKMLQRLNESLSEYINEMASPSDGDQIAILPSEPNTDALFEQYERLTQFPAMPKNVSRLVKDDAYILRRVREEKGITMEELTEGFLTKERTLENLKLLFDCLNIGSRMRTVIEEDPYFVVISVDVEPELCFGATGKCVEEARQKAIDDAFRTISVLLR